MASNKIEIFFSYSNVDVKLRDELAKHLRGLERKGVITAWHESEISAGKESAKEIEKHLNSASIILLLVSPDYISSDELWQREVTQAMKRHEQKEARVIPVLLRDYHGWEEMPFGKLQPLPKNGKPITDETWQNQDAAFKDVVQGIQQAVKEISKYKILADPTKPFTIKLFLLIPWLLLCKIFIICTGVTLIVAIMRAVGIFEPSELWFYDQMMSFPFQMKEEPDKRLLIVEVTPNDIQKYGRPQENEKPSPQNTPQYGASLPDKIIHKLLKKLLDKKARVIGLDLYRDFHAYDENLKRLFNDPEKIKNLIFICKLPDIGSTNEGYNPPPDIPKEQVGFSDLVFDKGGVIRRQLLRTDSNNENSQCGTSKDDESILMESFALKIAQKYLELEKNEKFTLLYENSENDEDNPLTFKSNNIILEPLDTDKLGGYKLINEDNYNGLQILLRYRNVKNQNNNFFQRPTQDSTLNIARKATVEEILENKIPQRLVKDNIILIGVVHESYDHLAPTPFSNAGSEPQMWGLYIQAQKVSQIVSAALDNRRLINVWYLQSEILWMITWGIAGAVIVQFFQKPKQLVIAAGIGIFFLYIFCLGIFILPTTKTWIPFTPTVVVFLGSTGILFIIDVQLKEKKN